MVASRMMVLLALTFVLSLCLESVQGQEELFFLQGELHGTIMTTRNGRNISAYLGIPYAKPPVGPLRFKPPQRVYGWNGVLMGDTDGNQCPQFNDAGVLVGDEDCLYLNVYSPETFPEQLYPTMVYFHGGGFVKGSGSSTDAGPGYLLDRDIVLVTVNYRLGVLGFLSTGDAQAPGNFGLKDQVLALQWVQDNIIAFGGHPRMVTIFGQDAGGASTSLHAISDASNGLFQNYISQSGVALCFWARNIREHYVRYATDLGKYLNCPTDNSRVLIDCLREVDAYSLVDSNDIFKDKFPVFSTWGPVKEPKSTDAFLTEYPLHQMLIYGIKDIPSIVGNVADDGLKWTAQFLTNNTIDDRIARDPFGFILNVTVTVFGDTDSVFTAKQIEEFYFNGTEPSDKEAFTQKMTRFITDLAFIQPTELQMQLTEKSTETPLYYYSFDYRGTFSHTSLAIGSNENIGVSHGDDLIYLFPMNSKLNVSSDLQLSETDEKMIDIMIDLWTSFASTGTPISNSTSDSYIWEAYAADEESYLKIGNGSDPTLSTQYHLREDGVQFFNRLIATQLFRSFANAFK